MTEEKINKGKELLAELYRLKNQRNIWENAKGFYEIRVIDSKTPIAKRTVDCSFVRFDQVKLIAIARIDKKINEIQSEFDRL